MAYPAMTMTAKKTVAQPAAVEGAYPLPMATRGACVQIAALRGEAAEGQRRFLQELGFVEGAPVTVVNTVNGDLIIEVKGARVGINRKTAMHILVR